MDSIDIEFEKKLIEAIDKNETNQFIEILQSYFDDKLNAYLKTHDDLRISCLNPFNSLNDAEEYCEIIEDSNVNRNDSLLDPDTIEVKTYDDSDGEAYEEEDESINIIGDENNLETLIKKANELLFSLLPIEQISFHIHNILNLIPNLEKEDVSDLLEPLKIHLDFDKPRVYNIIGCRMYQRQQETKK